MRLSNKQSWLWIIWLTAVGLVNGFAAAESFAAIEATKCSEFTIDKTVIIANLICSGDFPAAKELLTTADTNDIAGSNYLADLILEYEAIKDKRQIAHANVYQEQLEKLETFHAKTSLEETNNVTDILQIILEASEYATNKQRQFLLENDFVKQTIKKAIIKAEQLDSDGQWLKAYKQYYWRLGVIDPDNQLYSDRARQLLDKATIKASLQDSPRHTCDERHVGVKPKIFIEAINSLDVDYVVRIVDYHQMAIKAIKRCEMLAEVMAKTDAKIHRNIKAFENWASALEIIKDEIDQSSEAISKKDFVDVFDDILALNAASVKMPQQVLIVQFSEGALSALDQHTVIIWPSQVSDFEKGLNGTFSGIGITFSKENDLWIVSSILPDSPADATDLHTDDVIEAVDGFEAKGMTADCMIKKITGPAGTAVALEIKRPDENEPRDIIITRDNVIIHSIRGWQRNREGRWQYMVDGRSQIGYIRIATFTEKTAQDFEKELLQLEAKGLRGLILDLRSNPGGVVTAATEIVDMFVEKGMIVSTCPRYGMATYMSAHKENTHPDYPIVILINRNSASASEIVAGAFQDPKHKRAILVGERTFGKGCVQNIKHLSGNAKLKYTTAYYRLPSGQTVKSMEMAKDTHMGNWGILPDIEVKLNTEEYKRLVSEQKTREALKGNIIHGSRGTTHHSNRHETDADPQLAVGLLVLKSKMAQANHLAGLKKLSPIHNKPYPDTCVSKSD